MSKVKTNMWVVKSNSGAMLLHTLRETEQGAMAAYLEAASVKFQPYGDFRLHAMANVFLSMQDRYGISMCNCEVVISTTQ